MIPTAVDDFSLSNPILCRKRDMLGRILSDWPLITLSDLANGLWLSFATVGGFRASA